VPERTAALLDWYRITKRQLPWRDVEDPWAILVSEVMLQQTQVTRVVPAFEAFLSRFPDPAALAAADLSAVIEAWGGLGYQRRAVNLRRAAAAIATDGWPTTAEDLQRLPGVGPYTAAAVACFAFGEPVPAVDTNLRRVLTRWTGHRLAGGELDRVAAALLDRDHPSEWNQAVMDLGASVCRPRRPRCGECPVSDWCADPSAYQPPPSQGAYAGSVRQARAAVMRSLAAGALTGRADLAAVTGLDEGRLREAVAALRSEGLVGESADGRLVLGPGEALIPPGSSPAAPSPASS
jgi:A/G-specific adenine glycosylase